MIEIVPAILVDSAEELVRQVHILERAGFKRAHLDICDGQFLSTRTIDGYSELQRLVTELRWDIHLMVEHPENTMARWQSCCDGVDRFIVHVETTKALPALVDTAHAQGNKLWAAINPETSRDHLPGTSVDGVMFMTAHPGQQGNVFVSDVIPTIADFHATHPDVPLMADGGITPATAPQCIDAGVSVLVSGSHILRSTDPVKALGELRAVLH